MRQRAPYHGLSLARVRIPPRCATGLTSMEADMDKEKEEREALVNLLGRVGGLIGPCRECGVGMGEIHQYPCSRSPFEVPQQGEEPK